MEPEASTDLDQTKQQEQPVPALAMAESSLKIDKASSSSSSSSSSGEDSIKLEKEELPGGSDNDVRVGEFRTTSERETASPLSNGDGDSSGRFLLLSISILVYS